MTLATAKDCLDTVIKKARAHLYKPVQIAEILYRDRTEGNITLADLQTYRTPNQRRNHRETTNTLILKC